MEIRGRKVLYPLRIGGEEISLSQEARVYAHPFIFSSQAKRWKDEHKELEELGEWVFHGCNGSGCLWELDRPLPLWKVLDWLIGKDLPLEVEICKRKIDCSSLVDRLNTAIPGFSTPKELLEKTIEMKEEWKNEGYYRLYYLDTHLVGVYRSFHYIEGSGEYFEDLIAGKTYQPPVDELEILQTSLKIARELVK